MTWGVKIKDTNHVVVDVNEAEKDVEKEQARGKEESVIHHVTCRREMKEFSVKLISQKQF